jgi:transcriptional regulator with XRE-family HTH domain
MPLTCGKTAVRFADLRVCTRAEARLVRSASKLPVYLLRVSRSGTDDAGWGQWLEAQMQACGFDTNKALERASGVDNTSISRWKSGESVPGIDQLRKLVGPLRTPLLQLMIRAGLLSPEEAKVTRLAALPDPPKLDVVQAVRNDPQLLPEAREHLERQYGLLLRIQGNEGGGGSRPTIPGQPPAPVPLRRVARKRNDPNRPT